MIDSTIKKGVGTVKEQTGEALNDQGMANRGRAQRNQGRQEQGKSKLPKSPDIKNID